MSGFDPDLRHYIRASGRRAPRFDSALKRIAMNANAGSRLLALSLLAVSAIAGAAVQRTFVSTTGSDSHPCSLAQPCRSFATAINQTTAGGEVIVLDSAGYGPVTITKSVSIIAAPGIYAGISVPSGSDGITINGPLAKVVLRGLSINGQGGRFGINVHDAGRVRIENCVISNMSDNAIWQDAQLAELIVTDTLLRDNGGQGIGIKASAKVLFDHVRSEHNALDGFVMEPQCCAEGSATIVDSVFAYNGGAGLYINTVSGGPPTVQVERSVIASNGLAGFLCVGNGDSAFITLTRNAINQNGDRGVNVVGTVAGLGCDVRMSENVVLRNAGGGVLANGVGAQIVIGANTFHNAIGCEIATQNGGVVYSIGNNLGMCGTPTPISGY
jgi:hypothetical protein